MKNFFTIIFALVFTIGAHGQQFEESVVTPANFDKPQVKVGADFAMQFQGLSHHADTARLIPLGKGINLPTANLKIDAVLADGIEVNVTSYLSARHHNEAWVKGGYLLIDKLPFIHSALVDKAMEYLTFKVGVMEINYGDAHFRRSDNGNVIRNPFTGNYITDAFTTAPAFEALYRNNGIIIMGGITNGSLKPQLITYNAATRIYTTFNLVDNLAVYGKVGYDKQINEDLRLRATVSLYHSPRNLSGSLYNGDRTGSRFYLVMQRLTYSAGDVDATANAFTGNFGPGTASKDNSLMTNLFVKYKGLEFFGTYEGINTTSISGTPSYFNQYSLEGLYHFGKEDQFYAGARYNATKSKNTSAVNRLEAGAGWFLIPNILLKAEYVDQNYSNFAVYGGSAGFNGMMVESTISF
jgi:hypothetical protein